MSILPCNRTLKGLFKLITVCNINRRKIRNMIGKWFLLLTIGSMLFFSCSESGKPPGVLSREKMAQILEEVYILEEKVKPLQLKPDSTEKLLNKMKMRLLDSLAVPDSVFRQSLDYYWDNPKEMDAIYAALVDSLNLREQGLSIEKAQ